MASALLGITYVIIKQGPGHSLALAAPPPPIVLPILNKLQVQTSVSVRESRPTKHCPSNDQAKERIKRCRVHNENSSTHQTFFLSTFSYCSIISIAYNQPLGVSLPDPSLSASTSHAAVACLAAGSLIGERNRHPRAMERPSCVRNFLPARVQTDSPTCSFELTFAVHTEEDIYLGTDIADNVTICRRTLACTCLIHPTRSCRYPYQINSTPNDSNFYNDHDSYCSKSR